MVRTNPKVQLPPENHFTLSHILSHSKTGSQDLQDVNDSINKTVTSYTSDITEQLTSLANVENELLQKLQKVNDVYDVVHNIRIENIGNTQALNNDIMNNAYTIDSKDSQRRKNKGIKKSLGSTMFKMLNNRQTENRLQQYTKIDNKFEELVDETVVQQKRINNLLTRLKNIEVNFSKRERLFDEKSPSKSHFSKLYKYGMENPNIRKRQPTNGNKQIEIQKTIKMDTLSNSNMKKSFETQTPVKNNRSSTASVKSIKSNNNNISPEKLNRYLDIENELDEVQRIRTNKSNSSLSSTTANKFSNSTGISSETTATVFNPVSVITKKDPTCEVTEEAVTIRASDKKSNMSKSEDEQVSLLVDELKKLYN